MNKAIKYLLVFIILSICFYFLLIGFLGNNGLLYNKSLEKIIVQMEQLIEKKSFDIESLNKYSDYLKTEDGIQDTAINLGYYVAGDHYYIFPSGKLQEAVEIPVTDSEIKPFKYISNINCLLFAIGGSLIVTSVALFVDFKKNSGTGDNLETGRQNSGIDNFIQ